MIIRLKPTITETEYERLIHYFTEKGFAVKDISGTTFQVVGIIGDTSKLQDGDVVALDGVDEITRIQVPYKKASNLFHPLPTQIKVGSLVIGGGHFTVMAGPCSVESRDQIIGVAKAVQKSGAHILRVARLNREPLLMRFRDWNWKDWICYWRPKKPPVCRSSRKFLRKNCSIGLSVKSTSFKSGQEICRIFIC